MPLGDIVGLGVLDAGRDWGRVPEGEILDVELIEPVTDPVRVLEDVSEGLLVMVAVTLGDSKGD